MNLDAIRHPIRRINNHVLRVGNLYEKINPNQTTALGTLVTVAGVGAYVTGILSGNSDIAWAGIGAFAVGRYADLLDGDHAVMLRGEGKWNTKTGGIFDADMDKVGVFSALIALSLTNSLPEAHKMVIGGEIAVMFILDGISYRLRSPERDWSKVIASLKDSRWDESKQIGEMITNGKKNSKIDANAFGKIKTLLQTLGITALGVGGLIENPTIAHDFQKLGHPMFLGAIGFAGASLWSKMRRK